jgi:dynein heavy chain
MSHNYGKKKKLPLVLDPLAVIDRHKDIFGKKEKIPAVAPSADKKMGLFSEFLERKNLSKKEKLPDISKAISDVANNSQYSTSIPNSRNYHAEFNASLLDGLKAGMYHSKTGLSSREISINPELPLAKKQVQETEVNQPDINYRKAIEPKVMSPFYTRPGQTPRKILIERKKLEYSSKDITSMISAELDLLKQKGLLPESTFHAKVSNEEALTAEDQDKEITASSNPKDVSDLLSLEHFDNTEFDCRTSDDWLDLRTIKSDVNDKISHFTNKKNGIVKKGYENIRFIMVPLPAKAFDGLEWRDCIVVAHNERTNTWKVKWRKYTGWELDKNTGADAKYIHPEDETLLDEIISFEGNPNDIIDGKEIWVHRYIFLI